MARSNRDVVSRRLASYWNAPTQIPGADSDWSPGEPIACVATTYTLHAGFFENELLTRFLGLRFDGTERERSFVVEREAALGRVRVSLLVEARHVDGSQSTLRWDQLPVAVDGGVQHAKLTLLQWRRCLRLIVGSGNITRQGYRRNRESASVIWQATS